jgi:YegS/Rv2252/BmrU family lipid kinase
VTRALLIANPHAARTQEATVRAIEEVIRHAGWQLEVRATGGPGDARRMAAQAAAAGIDVVAVFGGDGTTMQAAAALVGTDTALGLLPGGTGNLLAGNLRLPISPVRAAQVMVSGVRRPLDLGRMSRSDGDHYFAVACGAGIDARIMGETESIEKHKWGIMAYFATTFRLLPEMRNIPFHITVDGKEHEAEAAVLMVANCSEVIPRIIRFGAGISPHDGILDLLVLRGSSVGETVRAVWDLVTERNGTFGEDVLVGYARGREFSVRVADGSRHPVQLDGEPGGETPFTVSVVPGAVQVLMPPE